MNPLALQLNEQLSEENPVVLDMLSDLGTNMYYPKGILTQSAEAKRQNITRQSVWLQQPKVKCTLKRYMACLII